MDSGIKFYVMYSVSLVICAVCLLNIIHTIGGCSETHPACHHCCVNVSICIKNYILIGISSATMALNAQIRVMAQKYMKLMELQFGSTDEDVRSFKAFIKK